MRVRLGRTLLAHSSLDPAWYYEGMGRLSALWRMGLIGWVIGLFVLVVVVLGLVLWPLALVLGAVFMRPRRVRTIRWRGATRPGQRGDREVRGELEWRRDTTDSGE